MLCWYVREKLESKFSLVACEDCLEVCFVGLVLGRNYVWCLDIVAIFMRFGQAGVKRCGECLKVINCHKRLKTHKNHKRGLFS